MKYIAIIYCLSSMYFGALQSTALTDAIQANDVDLVTKLLRGGADANEMGMGGQYSEGKLPLAYAVQNKHDNDGKKIEIVKLLLAHNANINATFSNDVTPLHEAARVGTKEMVELLLNNGARITTAQYLGTPLEQAASQNSVDVAELLLRRGDRSIPGEYNKGALFAAALRPDGVPMLKALISAGIGQNLRERHTGQNNALGMILTKLPPAKWPIENIKYLVQVGVNIFDDNFFQIIAERSKNLTASDSDFTIVSDAVRAIADCAIGLKESNRPKIAPQTRAAYDIASDDLKAVLRHYF